MRIELLCVVLTTLSSFYGPFVRAVDVGFFKARMFSNVNSIRRQYPMSFPLQYATTLDQSAQSYADELAAKDAGIGRDFVKLQACASVMMQSSATIDPSIQSGLVECGESLMLIHGQNLNRSCNPDTVVQIWNAQRLNYNYTVPPNDDISRAAFADFTQLIW
jgi:hypothetical protein